MSAVSLGWALKTLDFKNKLKMAFYAYKMWYHLKKKKHVMKQFMPGSIP